MRITITLIVALLAFPAAARQDHSPWWECVADYLSSRPGGLFGNETPMTLALLASHQCRQLSRREDIGQDMDAVAATVEHFRRLADMPGAPPAFTRPRQ
jgi:hypothetical protein